jgi:hypothetical protein
MNYGLFDRNEDEIEIKCPSCKKYFEPQKCGFTNCIFWITGIKKKDSKSKPEKIMQNEDNAENVGA